jgi:hypothetical protein
MIVDYPSLTFSLISPNVTLERKPILLKYPGLFTMTWVYKVPPISVMTET